jgi:hypothetical protein
MKTLIHDDKKYQAEKIIKTDTDIVGYTGEKIEFAFRGIKDFSLFRLADGQEWDVSEDEQQEATLANLAYKLTLKDITIQQLQSDQANLFYQLMIKGVI